MANNEAKWIQLVNGLTVYLSSWVPQLALEQLGQSHHATPGVQALTNSSQASMAFDRSQD